MSKLIYLSICVNYLEALAYREALEREIEIMRAVLWMEFLAAEMPKFELNCHRQRRTTRARDACSLVTTAVFTVERENEC